MKDPKQMFLIVFALAGIGYGSYQLVNPSMHASASWGDGCCQYSNNCSGSLVCCPPKNAVDCSESDHNYCANPGCGNAP
jgi:hypothetical protein